MALSSQYTILERNPTPQQYYELRKQAGLTPPPRDPITTALAGSWYSIIIVKNSSIQNESLGGIDDLMGMGRLVGDGALFLQLVDIAVHPSHQGKGIGRLIIETLLKYADENAPDAYISLIGDPPAHERFYPRFGFKDVAPSKGMARMDRSRKKMVGRPGYEEGEVQG